MSFNKEPGNISTYSIVLHIERDLYNNDGSILFGTFGYLQTTDGTTTTTLFASRKNPIAGFVQLNHTHLVFSNYKRHCIMLLDRSSNSVSKLAGKCGWPGYEDGNKYTGRLYGPTSIVLDLENSNRIYVADTKNDKLRAVDIETGQLSTIISTGLRNPRGMVWANGDLLITNLNYISHTLWLSNGAAIIEILAGLRARGYSDSTFGQSRFNHPIDICEIESNKYLIADYKNKVLRLLDLSRGVVGPVCINRESPCTTSTKLPSNPRSLAKIGDTIYVGTLTNIIKLRGGLCV